jgi:hypothetical protein
MTDRTVSYQIEFNEETEGYVVYEFETRHTTTGDEHEVHSIGPDFDTRHEAMAFVREITA